MTCALAACGASGSGGGTPPGRGLEPSRPPASTTATPVRTPTPTPVPSASPSQIQHVVMIIQENRSFDNLFKDFPNAVSDDSGETHDGLHVPLTPLALGATARVAHDANTMFLDCNGSRSTPGTHCRMNGFDLNPGFASPTLIPYTYVPRSQVLPYWDLARRYVLFDHFFPSQLDGSFVSHQYLIGAQAQSAVDNPSGPTWGCEGAGTMVKTLTQSRAFGSPESACFDYATLADELAAANLPWRFYSPVASNGGYVWSAYQAIAHIYDSPAWSQNVVTPETKILSDVPKGNLASVTWVVPKWNNSGHEGSSDDGPAWVASVENAVGESRFWPHTAIFILWDDWGGWYDGVPPPYLDYDGNGMRVPLLCVSPYARRGVDHSRAESAGIVRYIEDAFHLPQMTSADARALDVGIGNPETPGCLDLAQRPRAFVPIASAHPPAYFIQQPADARLPDDD